MTISFEERYDIAKTKGAAFYSCMMFGAGKIGINQFCEEQRIAREKLEQLTKEKEDDN